MASSGTTESLLAMRCLNRMTLARGINELAATDHDLGRIVQALGPPPLWGRRPGFATLVRIILEQQVSLASARAVYRRLQSSAGRITAEAVVAHGERGLMDLGFTRQKSSYCYDIAVSIANGTLDLARIARCRDEQAREMLLAIRGVGPWTADIYRLMALRRPDVWPDGDVALTEAARSVKRLRARPSVERLRRIAQQWRPWRSVAARILWHHYLSSRHRRAI